MLRWLDAKMTSGAAPPRYRLPRRDQRARRGSSAPVVTVLAEALVNEHRIHQLFQISVLLKGAHAVIECVGGLALALISTKTIVDLVNAMTQEGLIADPHDVVATYLRHMAHDFSVSSKNFYSFYLLSHGIVKLGLVIGLLRNQLWSYPASLIVLGLFIVYQIYRYIYFPAVGLIFLTVLDLVVIGLVWHEYRLVTRYRLPVG
jgi:uncharacterized membrane protein